MNLESFIELHQELEVMRLKSQVDLETIIKNVEGEEDIAELLDNEEIDFRSLNDAWEFLKLFDKHETDVDATQLLECLDTYLRHYDTVKGDV